MEPAAITDGLAHAGSTGVRPAGLTLEYTGGPEPDDLQAPIASVIVPCRNEASHIEECLQGILSFDPPPGGFEVLVIDGMSDDGTREVLSRMAEEDPRVRVLDNPRRTTPHALNIGIRAARGEIVLRADAHTVYAQDYLVQCLAVMEQTGADNVGGPAYTRADTYLQRAVAAAFHCRFAVGGSTFHCNDYEGPANTVPYGCYRRSRLLELGLFDEELVRNQDDELNYRLVRAGGRIWQSPRIRSWYSPRSSLRSLFRQYQQYGYWKVRVIQKHRRPASPGHIVPGAFVATLLSLAMASPFAPDARFGLLVLLAVYAASAITASVVASARAGWPLFPVLPLVFASYHIGYGLGSLIGIYDFAIRGYRSGRMVRLTRGRVTR